MVNTNGIVGISIEDTQKLLQQLKSFQQIIEGDWKTVLSYWQSLQDCWEDRQYDRFKPFFNQLSQTYAQCELQCEEYIQFLERCIRDSQGITALTPQDRQEKFINSTIQNVVGLAAVGSATKDPVLATLGVTSLLGFLNRLDGGHKNQYQKERQRFLRDLLDDPKTPRNIKGWIKQEHNRIWNQQKAKARGKKTPGGGQQIRGFPGYDVQHSFPQVDMASTFSHGLASINRAKPGIARRLGLSSSYF